MATDGMTRRWTSLGPPPAGAEQVEAHDSGQPAGFEQQQGREEVARGTHPGGQTKEVADDANLTYKVLRTLTAFCEPPSAVVF